MTSIIYINILHPISSIGWITFRLFHSKTSMFNMGPSADHRQPLHHHHRGRVAWHRERSPDPEGKMTKELWPKVSVFLERSNMRRPADIPWYGSLKALWGHFHQTIAVDLLTLSNILHEWWFWRSIQVNIQDSYTQTLPNT
jgi:hypothetical protein